MPGWRALLLGITLLAGLAQAEGERILRFGSYATERPTEELRKMEPFRQAIEQNLRAKGLPVKIDVRIFPTYEEGIKALRQGEIDFSRLGPASYVLARQQAPNLTLMASEAHEGDKLFSGVIVVRQDSPIKALADLKGRRMAFGDPNSTTGRYLAQATLLKAGIQAKDLASFSYLGRHDKVVYAVSNGLFDAGACNERTFQKYADARSLRVLASFPSPTQAWVARAGLDLPMLKALQTTLLGLQGSALDYVDRNGLLPANDADYDSLRQAMKHAKGFGE